MKELLFEGYTDDRRQQLLEDNCDAIENGSFTKRLTADERNARRKRNAEIDIELAKIDDELKEFKEDIKKRRQPLAAEKEQLLSEIKTNGRFISGKVYKFVDREAKEVGYYGEDGFLIEERRMTNADKQVTMHLSTGTDNE